MTVPYRYLDNVPQRSRWSVWAWSPVIVLRIALVSAYLVSVYSSIWGFIAGIPLFRLTAPEGWSSIWAVILGISAIVAAIGSTADRWQALEKWAAGVLSVMWLAYAGGMNVVGFALADPDRQFIGAASIGLLVLPVTRFVYLAAQTGKKKHVPSSD